MPNLSLNTFTSPTTTTIFASSPGNKLRFVPLVLSNLGIPKAGQVTLDTSETEDVDRTWTVTRNPVERFTAQNKIREPITLTITGRLSATPLLSLTARALLLASIAAPQVRQDRRELKKLITILEGAECFIVTPEDYYKNMTCTSLRQHYDDTTGYGVALSMTFVEFQRVAPGLVESTLDPEQLQVGAVGELDYGPQTPSAVAGTGAAAGFG